MCVPALPLNAFFALAKKLDVLQVEIRNDLAANAILDGSSPARVRSAAENAGVEIATINALQKFNHWDDSLNFICGWLRRKGSCSCAE
jgi:2-keto-myo-inositol isomerase